VSPLDRLRFLFRGPGIVVALLLGMFALRAANLGVQDAYLDEGFHLRRAIDVWSFDQHPARFAYGKLLVYFWLGLFVRDASPGSVLFLGRLSIALFSLVTGVAIYLLGRRLSDHATGVVALALYAVLPMAVFYERMAMADPFASGLVAVAVLAITTVVDRPTWGSAIAVGLLLAMATMAKLTVVMIVLLPGFIALGAARWQRDRPVEQIVKFLRRYLPWLAVILGTTIIAWLPVLVPAFIAADSDTPFMLFHPDNLSGQPGDATQPSFGRIVEYARALLPLIADFTSWAFLVAAGAAVVGGLASRILDRSRALFLLLLVQWMALIALPVWLMATLVTARYFVPVLAPSCLAVALIAVELWRQGRPRWLIRAILAITATLWLAGHVVPFTTTLLNDPHRLPFRGTNYVEHTAGFFQSDQAVRNAADVLDRASPADTVATWRLCHLIFLHLDRMPSCLDPTRPSADLRDTIDQLEACEPLLLAVADYPPFYERYEVVESEVIASFDRERIHRPVQVVRLWRTAP
jgi:hypothetical protein